MQTIMTYSIKHTKKSVCQGKGQKNWFFFLLIKQEVKENLSRCCSPFVPYIADQLSRHSLYGIAARYGQIP